MLKKYRNSFFEIIQQQGLEPSAFNAEDTDSCGDVLFRIELKDTPLRFVVQQAPGSYHNFRYGYTRFEPDFPLTKLRPAGTWEAIKFVRGGFTEWLTRHVRVYLDELAGPDLWQQVELQKPLVSGTALGEEDMASFTEEEKTQLRLSINEFRLVIVKTFQPSQDQLKVITDRLDYLSSALDRLNRIDWRGLAISTMLSISVALGLDTEKGRALFELFKQIFTKVVHLLQ